MSTAKKGSPSKKKPSAKKGPKGSGGESRDSFTFSVPKPSRQLVGGVAIGLVVATIAVVAVFVLARDGGEDEGESAANESVTQLMLAGETAELSRRIADQAGALVSGGGRITAARRARIRNEANRLIAKADAATENPRAARLLASANEDNLAASRELEAISIELARANEKLAAEEVASEEASGEAAELSDRMEALSPRLEQARRSLQSALSQTRQAVILLGGQLREDGELSDDAGKRLAGIKSNLRRQARASRRSFLDAAAATGELSEDLAARAEELEPDVVLDCVPAYYTVADFSVRNMSCAEAEALVSQAIGSLAPSFSVGEFSCSILGDYTEIQESIPAASDVRCQSGDRAFRFSFLD